MTRAINSRLDSFALGLQTQQDVPLWIVSSSSTIIAINSTGKEVFGPRGIWFNRLFRLLGLTYFSEIALIVIGVVVNIIWRLQCIGFSNNYTEEESLFIGFGAGPEEQMVENFLEETSSTGKHINQTSPRSMMQIARPGLFLILKTCLCEAKTLVRSLRHSRTDVVYSHALDWLVSASIRFSDYVFAKSWAESLPANIKHLVFISSDIPAFAVLDSSLASRLTVEYRQHGFLLNSLIFPKFNSVVALSCHEALHLMERIPGAAVKTDTQICSIGIPALLESRILIASIYDNDYLHKADHLHQIKGLSEWAKQCDFNIIVRKHPCETDSFWEDQFPEVVFDIKNRSFSESLGYYRPRFIFSWWSTTMLDALKSGILPILIVDGSEAALDLMVFPLKKVALNWAKDIDLISTLKSDNDLYRSELEARQKAAFGNCL